MLKNKLLISTALVSAMIAGSAAVAEIKMKGGAEFTYISYDDSTLGVDNNPNGAFVGREAVVSLSSSGDLSGISGAKWFWSGDLEDGGNVFATQEMGITSGNVSVILGSDTGHGIEAVKGVVPTAVKRFDDIGGSSDADNSATANTASGIFGPVVHDNTSNETFVAIKAGTSMGTIDLAYTPNIGDANATSEDSGPGRPSKRSGTSVSFNGNLGVDGLTVKAGLFRNKSVTSANDDEEGLIYGAAYNFGKFALGASRTVNNEDVASGASVEITADDFGLTFNATDELSVGLGYRSATRTVDGAGADVDLDVTTLQVGYSLGAIALNYIYAQADNASFINGRDVTVHRVGAKLSF
jgi:hypothetical protein